MLLKLEQGRSRSTSLRCKLINLSLTNHPDAYSMKFKILVPEILCICLIVTIHALTMNWIPVATTLPLLAWMIYVYRSSPRGHVFEPTSICDKRVLKLNAKCCMFKIVFNLVHFVFYMYLAIIALITT